MRKVIGIGETVLDIIFKDDQPIGAVPGGSAYNAIISLGRSGIESSFISEVGNDRVGERIVKFLRENGVNADNVCQFHDSKSPISLAFLNEDNNAEYLFYKDHPHDQLDFVYPDIQPDDIVLFGSYYAVNPVIRPQVFGLLEQARNNGAIIYYDVNFRPSHQSEVMKLTSNLLENLEYADIVRGSNEDFQVLFKKDSADAVYNTEVSFYCRNFIYTQGARPVEVRAVGPTKLSYDVEPMKPVSTIGAGDNFNAGFIYGLITNNIRRADIEQGLTPEQWDKVVESAMAFSADCCKGIYNYVSKEFGNNLKQKTKN